LRKISQERKTKVQSILVCNTGIENEIYFLHIC
jgi:hypothetical protein